MAADDRSNEEGTGNNSSHGSGSRGWLRSNLVALGSAAVLSVYAAGFMKTTAAAQRFAQEDAARQRPVRFAAATNTESPQAESIASVPDTAGTTSGAVDNNVVAAKDSGAVAPAKNEVSRATAIASASATQKETTPPQLLLQRTLHRQPHLPENRTP
jgi:hypothetical protein